MTYSLREALRGLVHECSAAIETVRQRVLPTPGKRKREDEAGPLRAESQPSKQRILEKGRAMGAAPSAEPRREQAAATPLHASDRRENGASAPEDERTPAAGLRPFSLLPGLSAYHTPGSTGGSNLDSSGTQQAGLTPASLGQRRLLSRVAGLQQRAVGRSRLWQHQYPHWGGGTPAKTYGSALDLRPESSLRPAGGRQAGAGEAASSASRPAPAPSQLGQLAAADRAHAEASAALALQSTAQAAAEPRFAGTRPATQEAPFPSLPAAAPSSGGSGLPLALAAAQAGPELAVARFELERARERRAAEDARADVDAVLASCERLMGARQAALLARTAAVLRESPAPAGADGSAQLSRVMLQLAQREAAALASGLSEAGLLEAQQRRLGDARQLRATADAAASAARPAAKPAGPAQPHPKAPAGDVVDLGSSSDEEESAGDEAATRVGEASAEESGSEGEEAELRALLRGAGVSEARVPAGWPPLSRRQKALYADAMDPDADQARELRVHRGTFIGVTRGILACLKPRTWLNDEVVNVFLGLLQERDKAWRGSGRFPKCHFYNSFFLNKLCGVQQPYSYSYEQVRRWTRPAKLAAAGQASASVCECDRLIVAVHLPAHWVCAVADLARRELLFLDSMGSRQPQLMEAFRRYVSDEFRDKQARAVDTSRWPIKYPRVPQQENGSDCGVFALMFAEAAARGAPPTFAQADMPYFRAMVTAAVMELKAPDRF